MKKQILTLLFMGTWVLSFSQIPSSDSISRANAEKQGAMMAKLLLEKNYKAFTAFTYAPIIKMAGGLDKMSSFMEQSFKKMKDDGFTISNVTVGNCSKIIHIGKQLQCTIPEIIELKHTDGKLIQKSTIIGISNDNGNQWTFIDTHGATLKKLQETIKELSNKLVIELKQEPEIISN